MRDRRTEKGGLSGSGTFTSPEPLRNPFEGATRLREGKAAPQCACRLLKRAGEREGRRSRPTVRLSSIKGRKVITWTQGHFQQRAI